MIPCIWRPMDVVVLQSLKVSPKMRCQCASLQIPQHSVLWVVLRITPGVNGSKV